MGLTLLLSRLAGRADDGKWHPQCQWGQCFPGWGQWWGSCCTWWPPWHLSLLWVLCSNCVGNAEPCGAAGELQGLHQKTKSQDVPCASSGYAWCPPGTPAVCRDLQEKAGRDAGRPCPRQHPAHGRTQALPRLVQHDVAFSSFSLASA